MTRESQEKDREFRSGFIAIIGRPNVGKSTLLNALLGEKISIVSRKPQTTRNVIRGVKHLSGAQLVFIDTPGLHRTRGKLNAFMVREALGALRDVDCVAMLIDASSPPGAAEGYIIENLKKLKCPVMLVINKIDLVPRDSLLPLIETSARAFPFKEIIPISALKSDGLDGLLKAITAIMPEGPSYFPLDVVTDSPERFIAAEMVREKVFRLTHQELPYSVAVVVEDFIEKPGKKGKKGQKGESLVSIRAVINVERDSQKGIIIGKKGEMLKKIGTRAREDIEGLLGVKVFLELFVRVKKGWTGDERALRDLGYH